MELTNKARLDFNKWYDVNYNDYHYLFTNDEKYTSVINNIIIEWFDSVKINIHTDITDEYYIGKIYVKSLNYPDFIDRYYHACDRGYVIRQLIEKANEIYNASLI